MPPPHFLFSLNLPSSWCTLVASKKFDIFKVFPLPSPFLSFFPPNPCFKFPVTKNMKNSYRKLGSIYSNLLDTVTWNSIERKSFLKTFHVNRFFPFLCKMAAIIFFFLRVNRIHNFGRRVLYLHFLLKNRGSVPLAWNGGGKCLKIIKYCGEWMLRRKQNARCFGIWSKNESENGRKLWGWVFGEYKKYLWLDSEGAVVRDKHHFLIGYHFECRIKK